MLNFTPKGWRHIQEIYTNNVHKSNRQRHSKNIQIKWKQIDLHSKISKTISVSLHWFEFEFVIFALFINGLLLLGHRGTVKFYYGGWLRPCERKNKIDKDIVRTYK
jgi:hypothetical protein